MSNFVSGTRYMQKENDPKTIQKRCRKQRVVTIGFGAFLLFKK